MKVLHWCDSCNSSTCEHFKGEELPPWTCTRCCSDTCEHVVKDIKISQIVIDLSPNAASSTELVKPNWKFNISYVDHDGVIIHESGMVKAPTALAVYKWVAITYRPKSVSGFFRNLQVVALDDEGVELGPPTKQSLSDQVKLALGQKQEKEKKSEIDFNKISAFTFKYAGPLHLDEDKKHKFYDVVPHF